MTERRQRIIDRAHVILGLGGESALTIERLSREAEVAPRTIYRLFNDKEGVILATVTERFQEVRNHIAARKVDYCIENVFAELDWMVSEMRRDLEYGLIVVGFFFSQNPRKEAIRELGSVAYNRFRNWMDREIRAGHTVKDLDLEQLAQEHVSNEYVVYHRWAAGLVDDERCKLELHAAFLKSAILVLAEPTRSAYVGLLADIQRGLGLSAIGAAASTNRRQRDAGEDFNGRTDNA